ncbi:hypothetical protein AWENTII_009901 [Aspergillus wentii]
MWDLRMAASERGVSTCGSKELYNGNSDAVRDIRWSPSDGVMFATATDSGAVQLWDYRKTAAPLLRIAAHDRPCFSVDWHPDGKHIVSGGTDKQVKVWDFSSSAERRQKPTFQFRTPQAVLNVRWRPPSWAGESGSSDWQSSQVATSYDKEDPRVQLWDLRRPHIPFREFDRYDTYAADLLWHSKDLLWTVGDAGAFTQTDIRYAPQVVNQRPTCSVAWSPNGEMVAFGQKRPRRSTRGLSTTEFLGFQDDEGSSGEKLLSQSPADDILGEPPLPPSIRHRHSKSTSAARPSKSLGSTPPGAPDFTPVLALDKALAKDKAPGSRQLGAVGTIPGATMDPVLFRYLARQYSPLMEDMAGKRTQVDVLRSLLESLDHNAEHAENASQLKLAQTWRIIKFAVVQELQLKAREQRQTPEKGNSSVKKKMSKEGLLSEKSRPLEDGKQDKMKKRLFKGVMETEGQRNPLSDTESASNMTTPLAQPLPDSPVGSFDSTDSQITSLNDDLADIQPLPPSVLSSSNQGTMSSNGWSMSDVDPRPVAQLRHRQSNGSEPVPIPSDSLPSDQLRGSVPPELHGDQRSAPRAITGRADWRDMGQEDFPKEGSTDYYDQKLEDKRAAIRDYKLFPKKPLSLESPMDPTKAAGFHRHGSSESFPMFSASTESSHPAKSTGASYTSNSKLYEASNIASHNSIEGGEVDENGIEAPLLTPGTVQDGVEIRGGASFGESPPDTNHVHLERPSSPPPLLTESSPIKTLEQEADSQIIDPSSDVQSTHFVIPGTNEDLSGVTLPITPDVTENKPWSVEVLLKEAIRHYHSSSQADIQSAAHLLHKLHVLFQDCEKILPFEDCEMIFQTYNEHLLRQFMYVEAAELRQLCVPSYPSVYEYAQTDSFMNVFCFTCKRPYENPRHDNSRCHRCNTPQDPCAICMSVDPPPEWVAEHSAAHAEQELDFEATSNLLSSRSSIRTETIPESEVQRLDGESSFAAPRPKGSALWTWCQGCGHGGHMACISIWLQDVSISEGGCATAGCMHDCGPGPRREHNRTATQEESKRRDSSGRKAGVGFVKRDPWSRGESKAVEKVRGMLGVASGGAASASTTSSGGAGGGSSGMMSPKKVRLVTPSEQGKRRATRTSIGGGSVLSG